MLASQTPRLVESFVQRIAHGQRQRPRILVENFRQEVYGSFVPNDVIVGDRFLCMCKKPRKRKGEAAE